MTTFQLKLLGGVTLTGPAGPVTGPAAQRLRLAILALLATARGATMSRDKLIAYLWPEAEASRARQNLAVAVHALRGTLGEEALVTAGDALRLDPAAVGTDVAEFEAAEARGELERAAALYTGPFLDGFHVANAPAELEDWIHAERERLRQRYAGLLERLARERDARGDARGAVDAWRRLAALEPLSSRGALGLMRALARAGDRAGALRHAQVHESLLRAELGTPPEPAVAELVARLRAEAEAPPARSSLAMSRPVEAAAEAVVLPPLAAPPPPPPATPARLNGGAPAVVTAPGGGAARVYAELLRRALAGRYAIERELSRGGAAAQYLALAATTGRPVVLHVFEPAVAAASDTAVLVDGLVRARALDHPNLLPMLDAAESEGVVYFAAPVTGGETLRDRVKREGQLPLGDALRIARDLAGALAHAHEREVVHRDVRPKHVLLVGGDREGAALLANTGVASAVLAAAGERATQSGFVVGTPAYMSPEQVAGETRLDGRSDIYSLGCVLYEMLAGEPPLAARSPQAAAARRLHAAAPGVRDLRESVPEEVDRVVARALARSPADRFRTAAELRDALAAFAV